MSTYKIGLEYEQKISREFHEKYTPVLISALLLRRLGAGQVDLAYIDSKSSNTVVLVEIKKNLEYFSAKQRQRLGRSQEFMAQVFEKDVVLRLV